MDFFAAELTNDNVRVRVAILHPAPDPALAIDEDVQDVKSIAHFLCDAGYDAWLCCVDTIPQMIDILRRDRPGLLFNFCDPDLYPFEGAGYIAASVVYNEEELRKRVQLMLDHRIHPALVEEFIDGREFTVALLETGDREFTVFPIVEVLFENLPEGCPRIYTYEAKFVEDSPESCGTSLECPANLEPDLEESIKQAAVAAARAVGARDYVRIDVRVRRDDNAVFVHDVNPNPAFSAGSAYVFAAESSGRTFAQIAREIVECSRSFAACLDD